MKKCSEQQDHLVKTQELEFFPFVGSGNVGSHKSLETTTLTSTTMMATSTTMTTATTVSTVFLLLVYRIGLLTGVCLRKKLFAVVFLRVLRFSTDTTRLGRTVLTTHNKERGRALAT